MAWVVLLSIIALPVVEIALFLTVVDSVGLLAAVAGAVIAGLAGLALWRLEGLRILVRAQETINRGEMPTTEVFDGVCLLLAGGLLLLPGFLSDVVGLTLLLPPVRYGLRLLVAGRMTVRHPAPPPAAPSRPMIIDADYHEVSDDDKPPR